MSAEHPLPNPAVEAVAKLFQLLSPLPPEERERAVSAAFILMGQPQSSAPRIPAITNPMAAASQNPMAATASGFPQKAEAWLSKNGVSAEALEHVFSIESDGIEVIAANLPGNSKRQNTYEAYLLCGLKEFLRTGEMAFSDRDARSICQKVGCYDSANHSNYMKAFGNSIAGSKDAGWKITNPGLVEAARVVKSLSGI